MIDHIEKYSSVQDSDEHHALAYRMLHNLQYSGKYFDRTFNSNQELLPVVKNYQMISLLVLLIINIRDLVVLTGTLISDSSEFANFIEMQKRIPLVYQGI